jgi:hypothetical protein
MSEPAPARCSFLCLFTEIHDRFLRALDMRAVTAACLRRFSIRSGINTSRGLSKYLTKLHGLRGLEKSDCSTDLATVSSDFNTITLVSHKTWSLPLLAIT